jgi:hypothetical protein
MASTSKEPVPFRGTAKPLTTVKVYTRGDDVLRATVKADHTGFFSGVIADLAEGLYKFYAVAVAAGWLPSRPSGTTDCTVDRNVPVVTGFTVPATSYDLTFPVLTFTATDLTGVTGYIITESGTAPSLSYPGWSPTPPTTHTVLTRAPHTLYPWVRDIIGNVSPAYQGQDIDIVSPALPEVTGFTMPATSYYRAIPVLTFTGTPVQPNYPNYVQRYLITESATPPLANDPGWGNLPTTNFYVTGDGPHTLYAWVKDNYEQVSAPFPGQVTTKLAAMDFMAAVKQDAPTSLYEMDEAAGVVLTAWVGNNGSINNATFGVAGELPTTLALETTGARLATAPNAGGTGFTPALSQPWSLELSVYGLPLSPGGNRGLLSSASSYSAVGVVLHTHFDNSLWMILKDNAYNGSIVISPAITVGNGWLAAGWNHVTFTADGSNLASGTKMYLNGNPVAVSVEPSSPGISAAVSYPSDTLFAEAPQTTLFPAGTSFDYVAWWLGTELTPQQALEHYQGRGD